MSILEVSPKIPGFPLTNGALRCPYRRIPRSLPESVQVSLNLLVTKIAHFAEGAMVTLSNGTELEADYALVSFSLDVLQHDNVTWEPDLPTWKIEAIQSMAMVRCFCLSSRIHPSHPHIGRVRKDLLAIP